MFYWHLDLVHTRGGDMKYFAKFSNYFSYLPLPFNISGVLSVGVGVCGLISCFTFFHWGMEGLIMKYFENLCIDLSYLPLPFNISGVLRVGASIFGVILCFTDVCIWFSSRGVWNILQNFTIILATYPFLSIYQVFWVSELASGVLYRSSLTSEFGWHPGFLYTVI